MPKSLKNLTMNLAGNYLEYKEEILKHFGNAMIM